MKSKINKNLSKNTLSITNGKVKLVISESYANSEYISLEECERFCLEAIDKAYKERYTRNENCN